MLRSLARAAGALALMLAGAAHAVAETPMTMAPVTVDNVWARATAPSAGSAAIYLTLKSPAGDTLTGASTPAASSATVHEMSMTNGIMRMRPVEGGLKLPPDQAVTLKPGGYHIMLEGLKAPLKPGETVPVHLTFKTAPPIDVLAHVEAIGASAYVAPGAKPATPAATAMPGMAPGMQMDPGMKMSP